MLNGDAITYQSLLVALALPWAVGIIWMRLILIKAAQWNWYIVLGHGYFLGIFSTVLILRLCNLNVEVLEFKLIACVLLLLGVAGLLLQRLLPKPHRQIVTEGCTENWEKLAISLLLALMTLRFQTLFQEISIRPLYSWDAWMNWAPKAVVWFNQQNLVPFVSPEDWLRQLPGENNYTLGNGRAWNYPTTVPMIILWTMMGAGTWDSPLVYLPWLIAACALCFALYGHLRLAGAPAVVAVIASYFLLSLPYFNVHTVLAGYADLWLASTFGLSFFCLFQWRSSQKPTYLLLCIFWAVLCSQLKVPGIVLSVIILVSVLRAGLNLNHKLELTLSVLFCVTITYGLLYGINLNIFGVYELYFGIDGITLPLLGSFSFSYHPVTTAFEETLFKSLNWNIFWYLVLLSIGFKLFNRSFISKNSTELLAILLVFMFLILVFFFTKHYRSALNFTTLNRAIIYVVPALIFYIFVRFGVAAPGKNTPLK